MLMDLPESSPMRFLLGRWEGEGGGDPGEGSGALTFRLDLQDSVIVRTNCAAYPATLERPVSRHDGLMVIYTDPLSAHPRATYFDSDGHVISYAIEESPASGMDRFTREAIPNNLCYRPTYISAQARLVVKATAQKGTILTT